MSEEDIHISYDPVQRMVCVFCRARMDVSSIPPFTKATCPSCKNEVTVPARLGAFLLTELLGTGGMGGVYRAHDETLGRDVAIKVMLKSLGDNPEFVASFRREAQAAAKLNHPNIAQIYSFGQERGQPYIVMELVPGLHFDEMISAPEPLAVPLIMKIGHDVAEGLQTAAEANLIHGDIKPENILLDERDQPKLVDFGIAAKPSSGESEIWGTPYYIAPERVRRQRVDFRSDIYCLGGTLYHAITQHPPFEGADAIEVVRARLKGPPVPPEEYRADTPPEVSAIVMRMLQMEPAMRYPTYGSLLSDIRSYLQKVEPRKTTVSGRGSKRFVIKGSRAAAATQRLGTTGQLSQTAKNTTGMQTGRLTITRGMFPDAVPEVQPGPKPPPKPRWIKVTAIVATALVALLLLGAGGWFFHKRQQKSQEAAAAEAAKVELERQKHVALNLYKSVGQLEEKAVALAEQGSGLVTEAVATVAAELGEEWNAWIVHEEALPGADIDADTTTPDAEPVEPVALAEDGTNVTAEATAEVAAEEAATETEVVEAAVPEEPAVAQVADEDVPALARMGRDVFLALAPLRQMVRVSEETLLGADSIRRELAEGTNTVENLTAAITQLQQLLAPLRSSIEHDAPAALKSAGQKLELLKNEIVQLEATRERDAVEARRLAAERKAAEAEEARQAAEQAAIRNEVANVLGAVAMQQDALLKHNYNDVLRELRRLEYDLKYDEAKLALKLAIKRVSGLQELREFMIKRLNEQPFKAFDGWSVVNADQRKLTIRAVSGRTSDVVWESVGVAQMVQFIKFYLQDEQEARALRLRDRFSQTLNAAIYCVTFSDSEGARTMARELLEKAIEMVPSEREHSLQLLPEITL